MNSYVRIRKSILTIPNLVQLLMKSLHVIFPSPTEKKCHNSARRNMFILDDGDAMVDEWMKKQKDAVL